MNAETLPPTLSVGQAARVAGISRRHAYNLIASGSIPSSRLGTAIRVPTHRFLEQIGLRDAAEVARRGVRGMVSV